MATMKRMNNLEISETRTFGVEIEFFGVNYLTVVSELRAAGISVAHETYNHDTRNYWKLITDASVTPRDTGLGRGLELVSPPLKGKAGLAEVRKVMETLKRIGAKVDKTCGLHIHHFAGDLGVDGFKNLYAMYYKFESWIDAMVPPSRRGNVNTYCRAIAEWMMQGIEAARSVDDLKRILCGSWDSRYYKLNFTAFIKYRTIEFRQHSGTVEWEKAVNWITFTQAMVERAAGPKIRWSMERQDDLDKLERQFRRMIFGDYKAGCMDNDYGRAFQFQVSRRQHFAEREGRRSN